MDQRSVPSALSLSNYLSAIFCGIVSFLSAGVGNAEDSVDKGHIDAKSFRCVTDTWTTCWEISTRHW